MLIANPIYDAVFKFLMEDRKVAALIIGGITGFDVEEVQLRPTEINVQLGVEPSLTVFRLDFSATIRTPEGSKVVLIEIQKAKFHTDIMRFRRYLGSQYSSIENCETVEDPQGFSRRKALPLYSIYVLGHTLDHFPGVPVIKVARSYVDVATGAELAERDEFIETLTHDSVVIQVPYLRAQRRNRLETLLSVFDQALAVPGNAHELSVREEDYPEELRAVVRRLLQAISEKVVRDQMTVEDEVLEELRERERFAQRALQHLEEERRQKEEERRQKEEERRQKEEALQREGRLRELLRRAGVSEEEIDKQLN